MPILEPFWVTLDGPRLYYPMHVHHLLPLKQIKKAYRVDPIKDLRPICPNCHAMIHRREPMLSIDELRAIVR